jgi:hypothetical protein
VTPRDAMRRMLVELPEMRAALVTRAQWPAVRVLDDWRRMMEHALGQRGTGEIPVAEPDAG